MGITAYYYSVHPEVLERALTESEFQDDFWERATEWGREPQEHPDIDFDSYDKQWDGLWWLVDPARQRDSFVPSNALGKAVVGAQPLFPDPGADPWDQIVGAWRLVPAAVVTAAATAFRTFTVADRFDSDAASKATGYLVSPCIHPEDYRFYFDFLSRFYNSAAERNHLVLVLVD